MDIFKPDYNINPTAGSLLGFRHYEETKARMREEKLGRKHSEETLDKMSVSKKGNSNSKNKPTAIKIEVTDLETNISTEYNSIREAARALNCAHGSLRLNINSKRQLPYKGRYALKRV